MPNELTDRVAIVTGGGSGIGRETSELLSARGAKVAVFDREPLPGLPGVLGLKVDVTVQSDIDIAVQEVVERWGRIDIVINNAGVSSVGTIEDNSDDEWHSVLDVHVVAIARLARAAYPYLKRSTCASVVNTCSIAATVGLPERAVYSAAKGAIGALTRAMAADGLADGIRVNCVAPGTVQTPWVDRLLAASDDPAATRLALIARQPMGRLAEVRDVAEAICFLASPRSAFVTGSTYEVDGGCATLRVPN